jgi:hypothetical protein
MNNFEYISRGRVYKVNHFRTIQYEGLFKFEVRFSLKAHISNVCDFNVFRT